MVVKTRTAAHVTPVLEALLEHEAHVLSQLDSDWIAPLLDIGRHQDLLYLVMPYVEGTSLAQRLQDGPLTPGETLAVGSDLFRALRDAHDLGILHRDVKPSNVLVTGGDGISGALLIDFGLAWSSHLDARVRDRAAGTVRYMSPEAAGSIDVEPDERADLYSAGVTMFEALAGMPPFPGPTVGELLRQHLSDPVPELRARGVEAPRALDEVVQRLLRKDPRDRYGSADAVVSDLEALMSAMEAGEDDPAIVVGVAERRSTLAEPMFVGRRQELDAVRTALDEAAAGDPQLVLLEAPSGGGKSRLLAEVAKDVAQSGSLLLRGQGLDQAAPRPFQLLAGVAADVLDLADADPEVAAVLSQHIGEHAQAVVDVLPLLAELLDVPAESLGPEEHGQARSVRALGQFLSALGHLDRPVVIVLDDCQWADELTLKVLRTWWDEHGEQGQLIVIAAFRSEEVAAGHTLRRIRGAEGLRLPPLDDADLRAMAESMAGSLPEDALKAVVRLSEGSPFMASAVLRGMVESGALELGPQGWRSAAATMSELSSSRHAAIVLSRRITLLPADSLALLRVGAVLGKEFDLELAADLCGTPLAEVIGGLSEPKQRHIVWLDPDEGVAAFAHDKLRETVLEMLEEDERAALHLRAALRIEERDPSRVFELAYHFDAAGEPGRALPHALEAADQARAQHSLEVAAEQYEIARRGLVDEDRATLYRIALGAGEVAMLRGQYDDAASEFDAARGHAEDPAQRAVVEGRLGELAFKRGDSAEAAARTESALRSLGRRVPRRLVTYLLFALWEALVQAVHTLAPGRFTGHRPLEEADDDLLAARLYSRLAHAYWFSRGSIPTAWTHLREMNLAERYPSTPELAQAYSEHAPVMTLLTAFDRGTRYGQRSLEIRRELGDVWGQGQSLHFLGVVLYGASRYEECMDRCREAIRLLERTGDQWEINTARWHIAFSQYRLGELGAAVETAREVHRSGSAIGDAQARGISLSAWAKATDGEVPEELVEPELDSVGTDVHTGAEVLQAHAISLLHGGRLDEAADALRRARRMVLRTLSMQEYVAPLFVWMATVRREQFAQTDDWAPRVRRRRLRAARRAAFWARVVSRFYRNNLPHALRESGLVAAAAGRARRARRWFQRSLEIALAHGARAEHARTMVAFGEVGRARGWSAAEQHLEEGERALAVLTGAATTSAADVDASVSLADRFETLLDVGRMLASALTLPAIHEAVHDAALTLLRGETCVVLEPDAGEGGWRVAHGDTDAVWSSLLVEAAIRERRPVRLDETAPDTSSQSMLLADVRSGLCAPVFARGRAEACVLITNRQVADLYGHDEERLAGFITAIAGAAIENAQWLGEVQQLTRSLEAKVRERTAELEASLERERLAHEDAERHAQLLGGLAAAGRQMTTLDPDRVLESVVQTAIEFGFAAAEVRVLGPHRRTYTVTQDRGLPEGYPREQRPVHGGLVDRVLRERALVALDDCAELVDDAEHSVAGYRGAVAAPIWSHGEVLGVLVAGDRRPREVSTDELEAFELLAIHAGRALENARAYEEERRTVEQLAEADRLKDEFLSTASHELRTPLAVISGMGLTLEERFEEMAGTGEARQFVRRINANAAALTEIITTLLDFSRLQQGRISLQPETVDVAELLADTADRLGSLLSDHDFELDLAPDLVVRADPALLERAVENLLANAAKYTGAGTRVTLSARSEGDDVKVSVSDDGPGVADEDLERLTERFFRGQQVTSRQTRGLGLGLAFTDEVLRLHGSRLEVDSARGRGATFAFRLATQHVDESAVVQQSSVVGD